MNIKLFLLYLGFFCGSLQGYKADLIIFSFDRPLQLYALLESVERNIANIGETHVIYRTSDDRYDRAYQEVFKRFSSIVPVKQGMNPKADFKPLLLKSFYATSHEYVLFAVDDIIVQDHIDCAKCITAMQESDAYGFYLRLGKNITYCYMLNRIQRVPLEQEVLPGIYAWTFSAAQYDWAYPNTVDMTIYRKKDIGHDLSTIDYQTPNKCETYWHIAGKRVMQRKGLCYAHSKVVNLPLNRVQHDIVVNRNENSMSTLELLELFERGFKMNIDPLKDVNNISPHMAYSPNFVARE